MLGETIGKHYHVLELSARRETFERFLVKDSQGGAVCSLKILRPNFAEDVEVVQRFQREVDILRRLTDLSHFAQYLDHGAHAGRPYLVTRNVDGRYVMDYIAVMNAQNERMKAGLVLGIVKQAAEGAAALHKLETTLREIHPCNLVISIDGEVFIADLGLAKAAGSTPITQPGFSPGRHLAYKAPEMLTGKSDQRSDIYMLGALLYHLLAGRPPFESKSLQELIMVVQKGTPPPLANIRDDLLPSLIELDERCLKKEPLERPQSAEEFFQAMSKVTLEAFTPAQIRAELHGLPVTGVLGARSSKWSADKYGQAALTHARGERWALNKDSTTIGRTEEGNDICLKKYDGGKLWVGSKHARIVQRDGKWIIRREIEAKNKVTVNGAVLQKGESAPILDGDLITIAHVELTFHAEGQAGGDRGGSSPAASPCDVDN